MKPSTPVADPKEIGPEAAGQLNAIGKEADEVAPNGASDKPPPDKKPQVGQFHDLLNLIRQASAASERTQQAAKYSEMSAAAAGAAGQQAMIRAMNLLYNHEPTPSPFQPHPYRRINGENAFGTFHSGAPQTVDEEEDTSAGHTPKHDPATGEPEPEGVKKSMASVWLACPPSRCTTPPRMRRLRRAQRFLICRAAADVEMLQDSSYQAA